MIRSSLFLVLVIFGASRATPANSIMDMINEEKVEKLLAERKENASLEIEERRQLMAKNSVDSEDYFSNRDDDYEHNLPSDPADLGNPFKFGGIKKTRKWNSFEDCSNLLQNSENYRFRSNLTQVPSVSSLMACFAGLRLDKVLKSDKNTQIVTKKEHVKKDWCKTEPILQKIREEGCLTRIVPNRFCYGQCNSFYIPRNPPKRKKNRIKPDAEDDREDFFKSCGFCKPRKASWVLVTLKCPALIPPFKKKRVQRIKQCKCVSEIVN